MFFIFGVGPKTKVVEKSQFSCPVCRTRSSYELRQQRQYFSLFFIPLFPMSKQKYYSQVLTLRNSHAKHGLAPCSARSEIEG